MQSKEEIEKAKEDFNFFNEGDYITKEMVNSKKMIFEYIKQLETREQKLIEKLEEKVKLKEKEYEKILNNIDRKVSHTKDEHKIRSAYAEFGVKKGEMDAYKEIKQFLNKVVVKNERK